jgi:hypothetical protein
LAKGLVDVVALRLGLDRAEIKTDRRARSSNKTLNPLVQGLYGALFYHVFHEPQAKKMLNFLSPKKKKQKSKFKNRVYAASVSQSYDNYTYKSITHVQKFISRCSHDLHYLKYPASETHTPEN